MKRKKRNYFQIYNDAIDRLSDRKDKVPASVRWLYVVLNKLEHRLTGDKRDWFFRSIKQLEKDSGLGHTTIVKGIKLLKEREMIETWQIHRIDKETGEKSEWHITAFRILEI